MWGRETNGIICVCMCERLHASVHLFDKCKYWTMPLRFLPRCPRASYLSALQSRRFRAMRSDRMEKASLVCGQAWLATWGPSSLVTESLFLGRWACNRTYRPQPPLTCNWTRGHRFNQSCQSLCLGGDMRRKGSGKSEDFSTHGGLGLKADFWVESTHSLASYWTLLAFDTWGNS